MFDSPYEWRKFCRYLREQNRFVLNDKWKKFIETVLLTAEKRKNVVKKGVTLYRARIGSEDMLSTDWLALDRPLPAKEMGAPPKDKTIEGRINPRGIPYLYLANDIKTAISEIRPWLGQFITVGSFGLQKDLFVVDASKDLFKGTIILKKEEQVPSTRWEPHIWGSINQSFSIPVRVGEEHKYYTPTQYLSECFKNAGYDGIIYKSSLTEEGYNFALFDSQVAQPFIGQLYNVRSIKYDCQEFMRPRVYNEEEGVGK